MTEDKAVPKPAKPNEPVHPGRPEADEPAGRQGRAATREEGELNRGRVEGVEQRPLLRLAVRCQVSVGAVDHGERGAHPPAGTARTG